VKALIAPLLKLLTWIAGLTWLRIDAKRDQRRDTALQAAEDAARKETARVRLDDEIDQDTDLVDRARRSGVLRDDSAK
jgi:hypothetical protein